jgi:putative tryptophan/tyrosine transport system substrate-binding protein
VESTLVGALWGPDIPGVAVQRRQTETAASTLGLRTLSVAVETGGDLDRAFSAVVEGGADALFVGDHPLMYRNHLRIVDFAARNRLPAAYPARLFALEGGLMTYGPDTATYVRRAGYYVDRILRGAKPADLPVEQPMIFDFVVNMKTARELGITFPNEIMLQVTEVIQ